MSNAEIAAVMREQAVKAKFQAMVVTEDDVREAFLEVSRALLEGADRLEAAP